MRRAAFVLAIGIAALAVYWANRPLPENVLVTGVNVTVTDSQYSGWAWHYWSLYYNGQTGDHHFISGGFLDNTHHSAGWHKVLFVKGDQVDYISIGGRKLQVEKWHTPWRIVTDGKELKLEYDE
jgi:hypothetical protein